MHGQYALKCLQTFEIPQYRQPWTIFCDYSNYNNDRIGFHSAQKHPPCRRCLCSVHSPHGITFLHEMTSWPPSWKCDVKSSIRLHQSMLIMLEVFEEHSCQISSRSDLKLWNFRYSKDGRSHKKNNNKRMISDSRSVPDPKNSKIRHFLENWNHTAPYCVATVLRRAFLSLCPTINKYSSTG